MKVSSAGLSRGEVIDRAELYAWHHGAVDSAYWERGHKVIVRGEGIYVWDVDGHRLIDGTSGQATVLIGHGRREMAEAMARQATTLAFSPMAFGFTHPVAGLLGERLAQLTPGSLMRCWFASSGAEAVEAAVKIARQAQHLRGEARRYKVVARRGGYHGATAGALAATATTRLRVPAEPICSGFLHVEQPYTTACRFCKGGPCTLECADDLEQTIIFEGPETVAAFIAEPIATPETIKIPPPGYWEKIQRICATYGVLLIADEVLVGFGRSGRMFASEHFDLRPDIMTVSKGLASGYVPISAAIATEELAALFYEPRRALQHAGTYSGHPVACAAALCNLDILEREQLPANARLQGQRLAQSLRDLTQLDFVHAVNIAGLLVGVELRVGDERFDVNRIGPFIREWCYQHGLICRFTSPSIMLYPPLIVSDSQTNEIAEILLEAFDAARAVAHVA